MCSCPADLMPCTTDPWFSALYCGCSCSLSSLDYSCPAASALWITAALAASSRFISDVLWLLLQLQLYGLQLPCSFSSMDYSCPTASSRFISDVLWLQPQRSRLQLLLQLHLASFPMYYGSSCSFSYLASALWITAAPAASFRFISDVLWLQPQRSGLQLLLQLHLASFPMYYGSSCRFSYLASALWITAALAASSRFVSDVLWLLLQLQLSGLQLPCSLSFLDNSCPRSFISLHFRCIMAAPAASAI